MKQETILRCLNFVATVWYCATVFLIASNRILLGALCLALGSALKAFAGMKTKNMMKEENTHHTK